MAGSARDPKQMKSPETAGTLFGGRHSPSEGSASMHLTDQVGASVSADSRTSLGDSSVFDAGQACKALNVDPTHGLDADEADCWLERFGPNELAGTLPVPA